MAHHVSTFVTRIIPVIFTKPCRKKTKPNYLQIFFAHEFPDRDRLRAAGTSIAKLKTLNQVFKKLKRSQGCLFSSNLKPKTSNLKPEKLN